MTMEELTVYGAIGAPGTERTLAWELLALALERELGLPQMPEIAREPGGDPTSRPVRTSASTSATAGAGRSALWTGCRWEWTWSCCARPPGGWRGTWRTRRFPPVDGQGGHGQAAGPGDRGPGGGGPEPDPLCRPLEGFLPGYVVTVCPSREARVRTVFIENIAGR